MNRETRWEVLKCILSIINVIGSIYHLATYPNSWYY